MPMNSGNPVPASLPRAPAQAMPIMAVPVGERAHRRRRLLLPLGCVAVLALSLLLDPTRPTYGLELCPVKRLSGVPCPGCGITRAIIHCSRGDFRGAVHRHPLGPAIWLAAIVAASSIMWPRRARNAVSSFYRRHGSRIDNLIVTGTVFLTMFGVLRVLFLYVTAPAWWPW